MLFSALFGVVQGAIEEEAAAPGVRSVGTWGRRTADVSPGTEVREADVIGRISIHQSRRKRQFPKRLRLHHAPMKKDVGGCGQQLQLLTRKGFLSVRVRAVLISDSVETIGFDGRFAGRRFCESPVVTLPAFRKEVNAVPTLAAEVTLNVATRWRTAPSPAAA